jgi:hypothetical protein
MEPGNFAKSHLIELATGYIPCALIAIQIEAKLASNI